MAEGRGFVLSPKERWNFGDNKLECVEGVCKVTYSWDGTHLALTGDTSIAHGGYGEYNNGCWKWFFPNESKSTPFWEFKKQGNKFVCSSIMYKSTLTWQETQTEGDNRKIHLIEGGKDHPRGHSGDQWELGGSVPSELALFGVMFSRSQVLMEALIQRRMRDYQRCNAFTPSDKVSPQICINCEQSGQCITCGSRHGGYKGRFCKACAPRKNFCSKCGDPLGQGPKYPGFLCDGHGFGNLNQNCCRMKF